MREYSNAQLAKSHENYIFQRQRLRKFSAQNYLKIRETGKYPGESLLVPQHYVYVFVEVYVDVYVYVYVAGKYTHKTLNRVLENMPAVSDLTSCR